VTTHGNGDALHPAKPSRSCARVTGVDMQAHSANFMLAVKPVYVFPAVAGNPVVLDHEPMSFVHVVPTGGISSSTSRASTQFTTHPIADRVSDQNTADIVRFVRPHWAIQQTTLDVGQVASWRKSACSIMGGQTCR
jgi:hypothetical protein